MGRQLFHVRIWPLGRIRVGEPGLGEEAVAKWIRADTLFSALCHAIRAVWGERPLTEWLDQFRAGEWPLRLSSAFPFVDSTYFFPKPMLPAPGFDDPSTRSWWAKTVKKAELVPETVFLEWIRGGPVNYAQLDESQKYLHRAFAEATVPRVALDRLNHSSALYYTTALAVSVRAGFHLLIETTEETWALVLPALRWLGDTGLGGKRSLGMGRFRFEAAVIDAEAEWTRLLHGEGQSYCTLAAFAPEPRELPDLLDGARYGFVNRWGWALSGGWSARIRSYRLFTEGSVFRQRPQGRILDVTPAGAPHRIYRYAVAFPVRVEVSRP